MKDSGLVQVHSPSEFFLSGRTEVASGSVVVPSIEGSRPILVELQALVVSTNFGIPRRTAQGVNTNRVCALRVEGCSMRDDGVLDGDLVIGQGTDQWNSRDMVAAWLVDEKLATLKRIEQTDRLNVRLVPANPAFQPRIFEMDKVRVQAMIFAVFLRYWE